MLKRYKIHHHSTQSETKCAILERAHRTLRERLYRTFTYRNSYKYYDILPEVVHSYNHSIHRTHGFEPTNLTTDDEPELYKHLYHSNADPQFSFTAGGIVRLSKARKTFRKGYLPGWTEETFRIYKRYPTIPPTYTLQEIRVALKSPLTKKIYEISLKDLNSSDIFDQITEKIIYATGDVSAVLKKQRNKVIVTLNSNIELRMNRNSCPLLMDALNIKTKSHNIRDAIFPIRFDFSEITRKLDGEKFHLIEYENFPLIQEAGKIYKLKIRSGMYQHADALFKEFKYIVLRELVDSKVEMSVPLHTKVTFGEKLSNMLGFRMNTFTEGNYTSDYILELRAGITEVYVYCDIIAPSLVGDVSASILKIIPIANEYNEQIAKQFTVPLYFPIRKNYFDTIEIELVRSSGTPIKFISGKTNLVLSFRSKTA
ncbi:uncharacterized protein TNCV_3563701 [Trichonephila clavipes]|nr:uncharacterized protein TNCV_3563701 [Trichonephila clavipes]